LNHRDRCRCARLLLLLPSIPLLSIPASAGPSSPGAGFIADPVPAPASAPVEAEVTLVHATNDSDGGVDPRIGKLPKLGDFKSYRLLARSNVSMRKAVPATMTLPNGRILKMNLKEAKDNRFVIDTSINDSDGTTFLPLVEVRATVAVPVFLAGQSYQGGMLIIGIKVLPR
jgi:hypothetical protein